MSRGLNVDRMRRYVARTTPDLMRVRIEPRVALVGDPETVMREAFALWSKRMSVKHPGKGATVRTWEDPVTFDAVVEARVDR